MIHVEQVDEEVVRQCSGRAGEDAVPGLRRVGIQGTQAADQHRHLRRGQGQQLGAIQQQFLGWRLDAGAEVIAETVGDRLEHGERLHVGLLLRSVRAPGREGHLDRVARLPGRLFDCGAARQHDEVGQRNPLVAGLRAVELLPDCFEPVQDLGQFSRLVHVPVLLGCQADARAVGAAALVRATERRCRRPGRGHQLGDRQARGKHLGLQRRDVLLADQFVVHGRNGVLPDQVFGRHLGPEVAGARAHVAVGELEPGAGERVGKFLRVLVEAARDLLVGRIEAQRQVGRRHHRRVLLRRVVGVRDHVLRLAVLRHPLVSAGRALGQLPFVAEEHVEVAHVPGRRVRLPRAFDAAGRGVHALAGAEGVLPAEAHRLDRGALGRGADERRIAGAMRLAEGVAAGHQRDGFLVVHRHAREGLAHVAARRHRIRIAVRTLGVHVDQAHLHRGERVLEHAVAGVTALRLVAGRQPLVLGAPVDVVFRLPDVLAATAEAEGLEAHRLERAVAGQDHQVGPGNPVAVLLLDRPQQPASLVEVAVVGPAVERREALVTGAAAAATVGKCGRCPRCARPCG